MDAMAAAEFDDADLLHRARELFKLCDTEEKGFVTKHDMQRFHGELNLSQEQLDAAFDSLDVNGHGFLTLKEFTSSLGRLMNNVPFEEEEEEEEEEECGGDENHDDGFKSMIEHIGGDLLDDNVAVMRKLWNNLQAQGPDELSCLEHVITQMAGKVCEAQNERRMTEEAMSRSKVEHARDVHRLYDEMEQQISAEQNKMQGQGPTARGEKHQEMENLELELKLRQLERSLAEMSMANSVAHKHSQQLMKVNQQLHDELKQSQDEVLALQECAPPRPNVQRLDEGRRTIRHDVEHVLLFAQRERDTLVQHLQTLRTIKQCLQDEKDTFEIFDTKNHNPGGRRRAKGRPL
uniref:EF-hand calcium-binding domain-containing protein 4A-like isoform X2 n=1 Tax=Myxine glutinosa TaxID=7769 RepID=UPI00358EE72B